MEERNAGAEKDGVNVEADLVDHAGLEKRFGKVAAAHYEDLPAVLFFQLSDKLAGIVGAERNAVALARFEGAGKDVGFQPAVRVFRFFLFRFRRVLRSDVSGPASHHDGVDLRPEILHYLAGLVAPQNPVKAAVLAGDVIVEAAGTAERYLSHPVYLPLYFEIIVTRIPSRFRPFN